MAPRILGPGAGPQAAPRWALGLAVIPAGLAVAVWAQVPGLTAVLVLGLLVFGAVFAINSALHSFLILSFSTNERVTRDVGFYYMANAGGRLVGTLLSGLTFQTGGLPLVLATAAAMLVASAFCAARLR
jgi:hypothetical protein